MCVRVRADVHADVRYELAHSHVCGGYRFLMDESLQWDMKRRV